MQSIYDETIEQAKTALKSKNIEHVQELLHTAISITDYRPEAYNLLGIYYEYKGNKDRSRTFYRVSYYFDQSYKPAANNLERMTNLYYHARNRVDYGD